MSQTPTTLEDMDREVQWYNNPDQKVSLRSFMQKKTGHKKLTLFSTFFSDSKKA